MSKHLSPYEPDYDIYIHDKPFKSCSSLSIVADICVKHYPIPIKWTDALYGGDLDKSPPDLFNTLTLLPIKRTKAI